jgi:ankyrin repeat protein
MSTVLNVIWEHGDFWTGSEEQKHKVKIWCETSNVLNGNFDKYSIRAMLEPPDVAYFIFEECVSFFDTAEDIQIANCMRIVTHAIKNHRFKPELDSIRILKSVLMKKFDPDFQDEDGNTLLHHACSSNNTEAVKILCPLLTDINVLNREERSSWSLLWLSQFLDEEEEKQIIELYQVFLSHEADPHAGKEFACHYIINCRETEEAKKFVCDFYRDHDVNDILRCLEEDYDNTMLHLAVVGNNSWLVSLLLEIGAKTNIRNINGNIPLHIAVRENTRDEIIRALLNVDDAFEENNDGERPVDFIEEYSKSSIVMKHAVDVDPSLSILKECVRGLKYRDRDYIRQTLIILNRTPILNCMFPTIIAYLFQEDEHSQEDHEQ